MSRRSLRSPSTGRKRKKSNDDINQPTADPEEEELTDRIKMTTDEQNSSENVKTASTGSREQAAKVCVKQHCTVALRRAIEARSKLDLFVKQRRHSLHFEVHMTQLRQQLKALSTQLALCQKSNRRIEREIRELKTHLGVRTRTRHNGRRRGSRKQHLLDKPPTKSPRSHTVIVTLPNQPMEEKQNGKDAMVLDPKSDAVMDKADHDQDNDLGSEGRTGQPEDCTFTFLTLNNEDDYPNGSWLGDEGNPQMRVRCPIPPGDLLHVMRMYLSADKAALKLLDLLFDKETQAVSNISGTGKHNKKKLDPLLIFGLHCHLVKHFGINREEWHRIKQNIDSKCRTAFRRKLKGLELYPKMVRKARRTQEVSMASHFSQQCQHLQQVVDQLQTMPPDSLASIAIIQEPAGEEEGAPGGGRTMGDHTTVRASPATAALVEHTIMHQPDDLQPDQLKIISQPSSTNEIHLSNGQTIAITQSGELEIREVDVVQTKAQ